MKSMEYRHAPWREPASVFSLLLVLSASGLGCGKESTGPEAPLGEPPVIESFRPLEGEEGDPVTVLGSHFELPPTGSTVSFGESSVLVQPESTTEIRTAVPPGAATGPLGVSTSGGRTESPLYFIVISGTQPAPQISEVTPSAGAVGTPVTIRGANFDPRPLANHVTFNGVLAEVTAAEENTIATTVPTGSSPGPLSVATSGGRVDAPGVFTVETGQDSCDNPTFVSGTISSSANWTVSGCPYVILEGVTVAFGARLTIQAGVVVKLQGDSTRFVVEGELVTQGTLDAPVVITSYRDDTHAGDTNGDGGATMPSPGNWDAVAFRPGSSGTLSHLDCYYGGAGGTGGLVISSPVTLEGCTVARQAGCALTAREPQGVSITDCVFYGSGRPLFIHPGIGLGTSNTFSASGEPANSQNGIFLAPGITQPGEIFWEETEVPYVFTPEADETNIFVGEGSTLHVGPGVTVKLWGESANLVVLGEVEALGESDNRIVVTSFRDDSHGGDTNGDGAATAPGKGDWDCIDLGRGSRSLLQHALVQYGGARGRWSEAQLCAYAGSYGDIRHCEFSYSLANAVGLFGGDGRILDCYFSGSDRWGIRCASGEAWYWWGGNALESQNSFAQGQARVWAVTTGSPAPRPPSLTPDAPGAPRILGSSDPPERNS